MQDVRTDRTVEDERIFKAYGIVGYATFDGGVCDGASGAGPDDDQCPDGGEGLGTLEG